MKKILLILLALALCLSILTSFVACNTDGENTTSNTTGEGKDSKDDNPEESGLSSKEWSSMIKESNFENYTLDFQGKMTVTTNGKVEVEGYSAHSIYRVTKDALEHVIIDGGEENSMVLKGEDAATQKIESSQLYLAILKEYDSFTYDADKKVYTIKDATIDMDITAIVNGVPSAEKLPVKIKVKEGTATVSNDGKILKLVCDYSQTMTLGEDVTTTSGLVTWTFSNYGNTVINTENSGS